MRVAMMDTWGYATSWAARLLAEGADVLLYLGDEDPIKRVGEGIVSRETSYDRWVEWGKESPGDTLFLFAVRDYGKKADELRRQGLHVVGGGSFADKLEAHRLYGQGIAEAIGMAIPKFAAYKTLSDAIDDRRGNRDGGVFKSDEYLESDATQVCATGEQLVSYMKKLRERYHDRVPCIIQECIGGSGSADFDVNRWWDGNEFVGPYGLTMEHKRFLNDDFGPSTGCALNAFWAEEDSAFAEEIHFDRLAEIFRAEEAPPCIYAINCRISDDDGKAYFLEWTARMGYDSEPTAALLTDSLSDFLWRVGTGQGGTQISSQLAYSARMTVPPYPHEDVDEGRHSAEGIAVPWDGDIFSAPFLGYHLAAADDGFEVASPKGYVGLAAAVGDDLETMHEDVIAFAEELHKPVSKLQLRTDGAAVIRKDAEKLEALGIDIHPAILKSAKERVA